MRIIDSKGRLTGAGKPAMNEPAMNRAALRIAVGSANPVKLGAVEGGFRKMFPESSLSIDSVAADSGVGHQPMTDADTRAGAANRAQHARELKPDADYWVGVEGGVEESAEGLMAFAWIVVESQTIAGRGRTGTFILPPAVTELVRQGRELGEADDLIFLRSNSKQENGAVGILTGDVIDRRALYEHAVILALIPFRNKTLYSE